MTQCKLCGEPVHFNKDIVSERTGKKIPLREGSDDPHRCEAWKVQNRKYYNCNNCNAEIYFDDSRKSNNGKFIPISKATGQSHQCDEHEEVSD